MFDFIKFRDDMLDVELEKKLVKQVILLEYAFKDMTKPIGVNEYKLFENYLKNSRILCQLLTI